MTANKSNYAWDSKYNNEFRLRIQILSMPLWQIFTKHSCEANNSNIVTLSAAR